MRLEENESIRREMERRVGVIGNKVSGKRGSILIWFFIIAAVVSFFAVFSLDLFILLLLLISLVYIPFLFAIRNSPKTKVEIEEPILVDEDISHFKETVDKALKGNAIAQRDIELRVLNTLVIDLSIRYDLPELEIRKNLDNEKFLEKYLGDVAKIVANIYRRRHDLKKSLSREMFLREINAILEAMK